MKAFVYKGSERNKDKDEKEDQIWICSHPDVFTLGTAADPKHILDAGNIPVIHSDRGGEVTYHGPGQIIAYPLINLHRRKILPKKYLWKIEEAVIQTLRALEIEAFRIPGAPGLYVQGKGTTGPFAGARKICSIGIRITNNTTYHGLALNFNANLSNFKKINPCGYKGLEMANVIELAPLTTEETVIELLSKQLTEQICG